MRKIADLDEWAISQTIDVLSSAKARSDHRSEIHSYCINTDEFAIVDCNGFDAAMIARIFETVY